MFGEVKRKKEKGKRKKEKGKSEKEKVELFSGLYIFRSIRAWSGNIFDCNSACLHA